MSSIHPNAYIMKNHYEDVGHTDNLYLHLKQTIYSYNKSIQTRQKLLVYCLSLSPNELKTFRELFPFKEEVEESDEE